MSREDSENKSVAKEDSENKSGWRPLGYLADSGVPLVGHHTPTKFPERTPMDDAPGTNPGYQKEAKVAIPMPHPGTQLYAVLFNKKFTVEARECEDIYGREGRTSLLWALVDPMGRTLSGFERRKRAEFVARYENDRLFGRLGKC